MKTRYRSMVSVCMAVVLLFSCMCLNGLALSPVETYVSGQYRYKIHHTNSCAEIVELNGKTDTLIIPGYLEGIPVGYFDVSFFMDYRFNRFVVEPNNLFIKVVNGVLYDRSGEVLICVPNNFSGKFVIPQKVKTIASYAFYCCRNLTAVEFPKNLKTIESNAFFGCQNLKKISIPKGVKEIGQQAFSDCTQLESVTISEETVVYSSAFFNTAFMNKNLQNGVLYIGNQLVSAENLTDSSYTIKQGTVSISPLAFAINQTLTNVVIPDSVKRIGHLAFLGCTNLTTVVMPSKGCYIERNAFYESPVADSDLVSHPSGMTYYGTVLMKVEVEENPKESTFVIPSGTTALGAEVTVVGFPCETVWIPNSLMVFNPHAFGYGCAITQYKVNQDNPYFTVIDGVLYNKEITTLIRCPQGKTSVTIPKSVTAIAPYAFESCEKIKNIKLPKGIKTIGESAFSSCEALETLSIPEGVIDLDLGEVISSCMNLKSLDIPQSVSRLSSIFNYPYNLKINQVPLGISYIAPEYLKEGTFLQVYSNSFALQFAKQYGVKYKIIKEGPKPVTSRVEKPIASSPASSVVPNPQETVSSVVEPSAPQQGSTEQTTKVETPTNIPETPTNATEPKQSTPPWIWIACGGGVVLLGGSALWLWRKKKNK